MEMEVETIFAQADLCHAAILHRQYGYATAYLYVLLSTFALGDKYEGRNAFKMPCGYWRNMRIEDRVWYWALRNLRNAGIITTTKPDRHSVVIELTDKALAPVPA
jgi:hypothetical protein